MTKKDEEQKRCKSCGYWSNKKVQYQTTVGIEKIGNIKVNIDLENLGVCINPKSDHFGHVLYDCHSVCSNFTRQATLDEWVKD